jgi:hypothetical protein
VWAFLENTQPHHVLAAAVRAAEILGMLLDDEDVPRFGGHRDELAALLPLLGVDRFDRRTLSDVGQALRSSTGTDVVDTGGVGGATGTTGLAVVCGAGVGTAAVASVSAGFVAFSSSTCIAATSDLRIRSDRPTPRAASGSLL